MKKIVASYIRKRLHLKHVDAYFQRFLQNNSTIHKKENRVAVIQKKITTVKKLNHFLENIHLTVQQAAENGASYVIFPEYIFFDLFGMIPFFRPLSKFSSRNSHESLEKVSNNESSENRLLYDIFDLFAEPTEKVIIYTMQKLAHHYSIHIFTGSYLHKEHDSLFNVGTLIDPNGHIIHTQRKVHLTDFETEIGLARGDQFSVLDLPIGKTATPICMDATYFETFRIVRNQGADIVMIPIANNEPYNQWKALRGIWSRVQETYVYGLKSALTGSIAGLHFTGKAGIFAPIEMTENRDGIIAISEHAVGDKIVYADLDMEELITVRNQAPYYNDINPIFEQHYVDKTYKNHFNKTNWGK